MNTDCYDVVINNSRSHLFKMKCGRSFNFLCRNPDKITSTKSSQGKTDLSTKTLTAFTSSPSYYDISDTTKTLTNDWIKYSIFNNISVAVLYLFIFATTKVSRMTANSK